MTIHSVFGLEIFAESLQLKLILSLVINDSAEN